MIKNPQPDEYAPFYANYINMAVTQGDVLQTLERLKGTSYEFFNAIAADKETYTYAEGKWTIKQLVSHMIDAERVFAYRVLCFSRGDENALPGFDENIYVERTDLSYRTLKDLASEFRALRSANMYLFRGINEQQMVYKGIASARPVSVRALLYITAGHEMHHINIIKERYL